MPFSRRQKKANDPSVDNSTPPANDTANNITTTTTTSPHTGVNENEKTAANPYPATVESPIDAAAPTAPMPNHAHPGSGFGKLGDEEYNLRDVDSRSRDNDITGAGGVAGGGIDGDNNSVLEGTAVEYRTYKRRWFGLAQLTLLNIIVSWDVSRTIFFQPFCRIMGAKS